MMFITPLAKVQNNFHDTPASHSVIELRLTKLSPKLDVTLILSADKISEDPLTGSGTAWIRFKGSMRKQAIHLKHLSISKDQVQGRFTSKSRQPSQYDDQYSVVCEDMNFDGEPDLAFCNGNDSGYGLPSYDVYLFNKQQGKFIYSASFSKLAQEHLGLFTVDSKSKTLLVYDKSGAAWHQTSVYKVRNNFPVLKEQDIEDATGSQEVLTHRVREGGHWKTSSRTQPLPKN